MKRPLEHIIEEESRKEFALIVPSAWSANDFVKDYGKDIQLEIFKDYESTGKIFTCQVKGSAQKIIEETIKISIEIDHLRYFQSLSLPILLVFYSTETKEFWAVWANYLLDSLDVKPKQKNVLVKLGPKNKITKAFFEQLTDIFDDKLPKKINIVFEGKSTYFDTIQSKMMLWANLLFKDHFEIDHPYLPLKTQILIIEDSDQLLCAVSGPYNQGILDPVSLDSDMSSLFRNRVDNRDLCEVESGLLFLMGSAFAKHNFKAALTSLSYCINTYHGRYKTFQTLIAISNAAVEHNCILELQHLVDRAIFHDDYNGFQALNFGFFKHEADQQVLSTIFEKNMLAASEGLKDGGNRGTICYNLGSIYRNRGEFHLAGSYYQRARRLYPEYLTRSYWWLEYAGILAQAGHLYFAANFYKKFIEMDPESDRYAFAWYLLADAEFKSSQFDESLQSIERYLAEVEKLEKFPDFNIIKTREVIVWMKENGLTGHKSDPDRSDQLFELELSDPIKGFMGSITADPLNNSSLYNQGIYLRNNNDLQEALLYFTAAAVTAGEDVGFWITVMELELQLEDKESAYISFITLMQIFGPTIVNEITDHVAESGASLESRKKMISMYQEWAKIIEEDVLTHWYRPPERLIRMLPGEIDP